MHFPPSLYECFILCVPSALQTLKDHACTKCEVLIQVHWGLINLVFKYFIATKQFQDVYFYDVWVQTGLSCL